MTVLAPALPAPTAPGGLAELDPESITRFPNWKTGRPEITSARTADGLWTMEREETTGTPWRVEHATIDGFLLRASLADARRSIANGAAEAELHQRRIERERQDAARCTYTSRNGRCLYSRLPGSERCHLPH